ncbi:MAG: translation initiation factor IF-1A [Candidatus Aenigmarchaeota archaeon]|nr:translation initiation factor IF-1A [Candidatus Aenigmarchaeota archaeon]MDW8149725.1 translation initiation factor IF-1A [Candidatus Aenigmarchaeota archaeon]
MEGEARIELPKNEDEIFGVVEEAVGGDRFSVRCDDGKVRICRLIGKLRKRVWISRNDFVLVRKWKIGGDKKGDIIHRYTPTEYHKLKNMGVVKNL